jgi:hypothetical protein
VRTWAFRNSSEIALDLGDLGTGADEAGTVCIAVDVDCTTVWRL